MIWGTPPSTRITSSSDFLLCLLNFPLESLEADRLYTYTPEYFHFLVFRITYNDNIFILDPIDGTTNLIYDYKVSSISLAYIENGKVFFGIVFNPFSGEMFIGMKDKGSYLYDARNGIDELLTQDILHCLTNRLRVSDRGLKESLIVKLYHTQFH